MGYDINRFKNRRLPNEIICAICFGVLHHPQEIMECGHMFCLDCIDRWIHDDPYIHNNNPTTCPDCRRDISIENIRPAPQSVCKYIDRLHIRCDFDHLGCIANIRLQDYDRHQRQCALNPRKPRKCHRGCGICLPSDQMLNHLCQLDMCQDAIEWNDIFDHVRKEMKKKRYYSNRHSLLIENFYKKLLNFFTNWLADPRVYY